MHIAWPIGVSMMSLTFKGVIDMLMVGRLGTEALAAVGLAGLLAWNLIAFPMGMLRGQRPLVSQYLGAGDKKSAFSYGAHSFYVALAFGILFLSFANPISEVVVGWTTQSLTPTTKEYANDYLKVRLLWSIPPLLGMAVAEYLRSMGRPRVAMTADLLVHPINILLNWLLIFGHFGFPELGVRGAALGTGIADLIGISLLLWLAKPASPLPMDALRFQWKRLKRVLQVGLTGGVQFTIETGSFTLITAMIGLLGTVALAVHNACISIVHHSLMPAVAIGDGGSVLIGQYVGEKRLDLVEKSLKSTLRILMPFMAIMAIVYLVFGEKLMAMYLDSDDPNFAEAVALGGWVMIAAAIWQLGDALQVAYRFGLRAAGDHKWVMWTGILCAWILSVPIAWVVIVKFHGTLTQVWLAWSAEIFIGSWIFYLRWKSGGWKKKRLVEDEEEVQ